MKKEQKECPESGSSVFNRIRSIDKTKVTWILSVAAFVLVCFWIIGFMNGGPKGFLFLRYDKAGTAGAKDLPKIESQVVYEDDKVKVTVKSFGRFEDKPALALSISNKTTQLRTFNINAVAVNDRPVSSLRLKSDRAEFVYGGRLNRGTMLETSKRLYLNVGIWGTKRCYLTLDPEELADLGIDAVEEISMGIAVNALGERASETHIEVKTSACGAE